MPRRRSVSTFNVGPWSGAVIKLPFRVKRRQLTNIQPASLVKMHHSSRMKITIHTDQKWLIFGHLMRWILYLTSS